MPPSNSIDLGGIGADRDDILRGLRLSLHIDIEPWYPKDISSSGFDADGSVSPTQENFDSLYTQVTVNGSSFAPDASIASSEAMYREDSPASFDGNVSSNSSSSSSPGTWTPLERFCKEYERHERIALMMLSLSNCRGIYRNFSITAHINHDTTPPPAPTSTGASASEVDDGYQEHIDSDHPLERYLHQLEDHELLAYEYSGLNQQTPAIAVTQPDDTNNTTAPPFPPSGLIPDTERDVTPTSVDAPSSISLHPSAPTTQSIIPRKRSADAIEPHDDDMGDLVAQQDALLKDVRTTLGAANRGDKPRMQRPPRFRRRLGDFPQGRRNAG